MPRGSTKASQKIPPGVPEKTFIIDNGAYTIKAGFAPTEPASDPETLANCETITNCLVRTRDRKTYVAAEADKITQWSEAIFRRPVEHGQLVNWEAQKEIWDRSFFDEKTAGQNVYIESPQDVTLVLTEQPNTMAALQKNADEIVMEEMGFGGYLRTLGSSLNAYNNLHPLFETEAALKAHPTLPNSVMECLLLVDSGYSHTIVTPVYEGKPIQRAIRRLEYGGKQLTNLLKEIISIRHFDLHQDNKIVNDIKEDVLFVSQDFKLDMEKTWRGNRTMQKELVQPSADAMDVDGREGNNKTDSTKHDIRVDYVLPDGIRVMRGFPRPHDPSASASRKRKLNATGSSDSPEISMTLGNERFTVPEIIFSPSDIGSKQPGLVECIMQSLSTLPPLIQATMLANVLVVGGNAKIPGFVERLQDELRSVFRTEWMVRVKKMDDPITSTWLGGARMASQHRDVVKEYAVTKDEYAEYGSAWVARKFTAGSKIER